MRDQGETPGKVPTTTCLTLSWFLAEEKRVIQQQEAELEQSTSNPNLKNSTQPSQSLEN